MSGDCQACSTTQGAAVNGTCAILSSATICRAATSDGCDVAETCNGIATTCPTDGVAASGTSCRVKNGDCDLAETCNGTTKTCPADAVAASGTSCRAKSDDCDLAEIKRTSTMRGLRAPTGWISPLSNTRKRVTCTSVGISPTSSKKSVPPSAWAKKPGWSKSAPVKAPRTCPKS